MKITPEIRQNFINQFNDILQYLSPDNFVSCGDDYPSFEYEDDKYKYIINFEYVASKRFYNINNNGTMESDILIRFEISKINHSIWFSLELSNGEISFDKEYNDLKPTERFIKKWYYWLSCMKEAIIKYKFSEEI